MSTLRVDNITDLGDDPVVTDGVIASVPGRNLLYNGAMQVAQRGTSATGLTTSGYYTADRWNAALSSLGTWTQTIESDGPTGSGFTNSLKMECTTANASPGASALLTVRQTIEGQDLQSLGKGTSGAKSLTISFWAKSNVTGTYILTLIDADNNRSISASYTISSSGTWEKKTITFAGDATGAFDNDNNGSLRVQFWLGVGSDRSSGTLQTSWGTTVTADTAVGQTNLAASTGNYWQVTGVQLEAGTVATTFEHKAYGVELAECWRYYQRISPGLAYGSFGFAGHAGSTTASDMDLILPVQMRVRPTSLDVSGTNHFAGSTSNTLYPATNIVIQTATANNAVMSIQLTGQSGLILGVSQRMLANNNASAYLGLNAEL